MTDAQLFEKHRKEKCSICKIDKECEIHVTRDRKTRCTYDDMFRNESSMLGARQEM